MAQRLLFPSPMRSLVAITTLVAFLAAPLAANAQEVGVDVDLTSGEVDFDYGMGGFDLSDLSSISAVNGILPGDQPKVGSDTKEKVVIGLLGVAVGFALSQLFNKSKGSNNGAGTTPSIPRINVPGRVPGGLPSDTNGGVATIPGNTNTSGTVSTGRDTIPGGDVAGTGVGSSRVPGTISGGRGPSDRTASTVGSEEGTAGSRVATGRDLGVTPGVNVGRNDETRPLSRIYSSRGHLGETISAGTPR